MTTPRASLPELSASQASKEITHNAALRILEALTVGGVVTMSLSAPPGSPAAGNVWVVGAAATGAWAGKEKQLAHYTNGAWAFYAPADGWHVHVIDEDRRYYYDGAVWSPYVNEPESVQESVAAAGSTSATATAITSDMVEVATSTSGTADGVRLRAIELGKKQVVFNKTGNALKVYPPAGQQINYAGVDVAHTLAAWGTTTYYAVKTDSYYT